MFSITVFTNLWICYLCFYLKSYMEQYFVVVLGILANCSGCELCLGSLSLLAIMALSVWKTILVEMKSNSLYKIDL